MFLYSFEHLGYSLAAPWGALGGPWGVLVGAEEPGFLSGFPISTAWGLVGTEWN